MSLYIAAYDIADGRQRQRVAQVLKRFGVRAQRSLFEIWLEPEELPALRRELGPLLERQDSFDLYPVDLDPKRARLRWQRAAGDYGPVLVV